MGAPPTDTRVSLTKGQFLKIFRWQQQLSLKRLAEMTALSVDELVHVEGDDPQVANGRAAELERLAALMGCPGDMWERVGVEPGFPGTDSVAGTATASAAQMSFATQINRIAAMPEAFRNRQMQVIQKELGYIDG
jgi:hypothetical protein